MKKLLFVFLFLRVLPITLHAQSFYNGSFENNSATACTYTLSNNQFNSLFSHVSAFGSYFNGDNMPVGKTSLHDSGCYVVPQHGKWCVGLRSSFGPTFDAIALELTTPLDSGELYYVSFYVYGNLSFRNFMLNVDVGESLLNNNFGIPIYSATPDLLAWKNVSFTFTASQFSKYITVKTISGYGSWHQVDNFVISKSPIGTGIQEYALTNSFRLYPNPASENLTIQLAEDQEPCTLEICNQLGEVISTKQILNASQTVLDVSDLANGVYIVRMASGTMSTNKKIMISR